MTTEKISVVIATYNHGKYLRQAVESIEKQTYENVEIIIVDDGSIDETHKLLKEFEERGHKTIRLTPNKGKWFALNTGINAATGTLIAIQDADDASHPERLRVQHEVMKARESVHNLCLFTNCNSAHVFDKTLREVSSVGVETVKTLSHKDVYTRISDLCKKSKECNFYLGKDAATAGASSMFYKDCWTKGVRFLPGKLGLRIQRAEDSDHNSRMVLIFGKTSVTLHPLYLYRRNTSTNKDFTT